MMKLIGTRIRIEKSVNKTEYFPEYCLEEKTWFGLGKPKQKWYGVVTDSSHFFGAALFAVSTPIERKVPYTEQWAKAIIDFQEYYWKDHLKEEYHNQNKEITYVKYP